MRRYLPLLLVLAVLITAGCVEEYSPGTTVTAVQTVVTSAAPADTTPGQIPTPPPAEMAYLANIQCALVKESVTTYHCNGDVRVRSGAASHEVQVIARYPDNNTFKSGIEDLGGSNPVSKPFAIFPDPKYEGKTPDYFVKMDNTLYPVTWSGSTGIAWSNLPPVYPPVV